jgi:cyclophilin family peptidyl-prolyl cis-trans isomerase
MRSKSANSSKQRTMKRSILHRFLDRLAGEGDRANAKRGRLLLESLEPRQLLAGDVELSFTDGVDTSFNETVETTSTLQVTSQAEGELVNDLVAFAQLLAADPDVVFYGAHWCPACTLQKELFQDGGDELPFVEVTNPDRTPGPLVGQLGIGSYPAWQYRDEMDEIQLVEDILTPQELSALTGIAIPQSETPRFEPLGQQTVAIGSPLHVPIDVYDPDGGVQTVTVTVENPALVTAEVLSGNQSLRIDMATYGDMIIELFEQRAETATKRLKDLANIDFYDNLTFHRLVNTFVIQGGDPNGNGTGGSSLGDFADDYHPDLQHNRPDIVSYAKSADDTNDSQFFITERATRDLDFNHSVVGILTEGGEVREAISNHQTTDPQTNRPTTPIVIESVEVFDDIENSVIMLKATGAGTGSTNVTVTVTDPQGNSTSETFQVNVVNDTANSQPFLNDITVPASTPVGTPAQVQLTSTDIEGDAVTYFASVQSGNVSASVNPTTGLLTVTPNSGFSGEAEILAGVRFGPGVTGNRADDSDTQRLQFTFEGEQIDRPSAPDLISSSDSGVSNSDNITSQETLTFSVGGVTSGALVEIVLASTGSVIGFANAGGSSVTITTSNIAALGNGTYTLAARQTVAGTTSPLSAPITVVYDSQAPASVTASALTRANVGVLYQTDLISAEEGNGLTYEILSGPSGAAIDGASGLISWTPAASQTGQNTFTIALTDAAGNTRNESFNVEVAGEPLVAIKLQLTNSAGDEINGVQVGDEFLLNFIGVDTRNAFDRSGIFAAFADVFFDPTLVRPVPGSVIEYSDLAATAPRGGTFLVGQIDELGSAVAAFSPTSLQETLLATVRFEAIGAGSVNFLSDPVENELSEVLLFGVNELILPSQTEYRSASLAIGQNFIVDNDAFSVAENTGATTLDVLDNDSVVSGSATLSVASVSQPSSGGTVELIAGDVVFTPASGFNGDAVFTYRATDGFDEEEGTVTVTVTGTNDPPTGVDDEFSVDENSATNLLNVLANDSDPDSGETLRVVNVASQTAGATVTIAAGGAAVNYTPPTDFVGTDTFTYTLSDGELTTDVNVIVTVSPTDPPPTAVDDAFPVVEDADEEEFDILGNDTRDAADQTFTLASAIPNQGGAVRISEDGLKFFYKPAANFAGTEEVVYTIIDSGGGIATATATFTVDPVDDLPPVSDKTVSLNRAAGESVVLRISDLPANVDQGETLTFSNLGTPTAGGSVRIDASGNVLYTPEATFVGTDTFTFNVNDGSDPASSGTVTVNVNDFLPRDIEVTGTAFASLPRIEGIKLTGTNALNEAVSVDLQYDASGTSPARFANLMPGTYQIEIPPIPFLQNAEETQMITVVSNPEDGDMTVTPALGRLRPEYISIRDWLGSTRRQNILAVVAAGGDSILTNPSPSAAADTVTQPVVQLDEVGSSVKITGLTPSGDSYEVELPTLLDSRVQTRGTVGDLRLLKISVDPADAPNQSAASAAAAEGEQIVAGSSLTTSGSAEGEAVNAAISQTSFAGDESVQSDRSDQATTIATDQSARSSSVDAAMQDVASQLTLISLPGEALAEDSEEQSELQDAAVDAALSEPL